MSLQLPPDIHKNIQSYISSGDYQNEEDVLRTAMHLLGQSGEEIQQKWDNNNQIAIEQSKQGSSKPLDDKMVLGRMRTRLSKDGIVDK